MANGRSWSMGLAGSLIIATLVLQGCPGSRDDAGASDGGSQRSMANCPSGSFQCGYGCLSLSATCCTPQTNESTWDQGTSECPGATISSCHPNPSGSCTGTVSGSSVNPMPASTYCCSTNSDVGSLDCTDGTVVCNLTCVPFGSKCCSLTDSTSCGTVGGVVETNTGSDSGGGGGSCSITYAQCCTGNASNQCAPDRGGCPNSTSSCPSGTGAFVCNGDPNGCGSFYSTGEIYCTCT